MNVQKGRKRESFDAQSRVLAAIRLLKREVRRYPQPMTAHIIKEFGREPFHILVSCILSLRTQDSVSWPASRRLFLLAQTPQELVKIPRAQLERTIYPVGFYRRKAIQLQKISQELIDRFQGKVPRDYDELCSLPGVGVKTAALVLGQAFGIPAICVDTHVHRVSNRLGLVSTKTPEQTQKALERLVPRRHWIELNQLLVIWGQQICTARRPLCSGCILNTMCPRLGVTVSR